MHSHINSPANSNKQWQMKHKNCTKQMFEPIAPNNEPHLAIILPFEASIIA